jgi:hypothetical protein
LLRRVIALGEVRAMLKLNSSNHGIELTLR